jgi:hypothetical protein
MIFARRYNDIHVQENFHVAEAFRTMREPDCDVFGNASDEKYDDYRKLLVEMVLATDLSEHFDRVSALKNKKVLHKQLPPETILISALMCADLGHGGRVWAQHERYVGGASDASAKDGGELLSPRTASAGQG